MSNESPAAILFGSDGVELTVKNGVAIPANTSAIIMAGSDGTNSRYVLVDSSSRLIIAGPGIAGTPAGGILTIQGVTSGQPVIVSGTVTATNPSVGTVGSAVPASATQIGGSDGTNLQIGKIFDLDTGAGTDYNLGISIRLPGSGGSVAGGTATNPIRTDPTGTTIQPVNGTITANAGSGNFNIIGTGTAGSAASGVVTIQGIASGTAVAISGTVTANIGTTNGLALDATLTGGTQQSKITDGTNVAAVKAASTAAVAADKALVVAISPNNSLGITPTKSATSTLSNVSASATTVTLLALNANRLGATIYNDSGALLYIKLGATASTTSYTIKLFPQGYYEIPFSYSGVIDGIWASATGAARVSELT